MQSGNPGWHADKKSTADIQAPIDFGFGLEPDRYTGWELINQHQFILVFVLSHMIFCVFTYIPVSFCHKFLMSTFEGSLQKMCSHSQDSRCLLSLGV